MPGAPHSTPPPLPQQPSTAPVYVNTNGIYNFQILRRLAFVFGIGLVGVSLVSGLMMLGSPSATTSSLFGLAALMASVLLVVLIITVVIRMRWQKARLGVEAALDDRANLTLELALPTLLVDMAGIVRPGVELNPPKERCIEFAQRLTELGFPHVPTIVDARLKLAMEKIEISSEFIEPESVVSQPERWSGLVVLNIFLICFYLWVIFIPGVRSGDLMKIVMGTLILVVFGFPVARSFGWRIGESLSPLASMGVIEDRKGRRWSVDDSCLFVRKFGTSETAIEAALTGPAGLLTMRYSSVKDAGFRLLWQRWNHPHPRTELG